MEASAEPQGSRSHQKQQNVDVRFGQTSSTGRAAVILHTTRILEGGFVLFDWDGFDDDGFSAVVEDVGSTEGSSVERLRLGDDANGSDDGVEVGLTVEASG